MISCILGQGVEGLRILQHIVVALFKARNSVSFLLITAAGMWCARNAYLNCANENRVPAGNMATWFSHHVCTGPLSCWAANPALSPSLYGYSVNLDSIV